MLMLKERKTEKGITSSYSITQHLIYLTPQFMTLKSSKTQKSWSFDPRNYTVN